MSRYASSSEQISSNDEDDALVLRARGGDRVAFELLLRRHREWVLGLLRAIVQDREQAEDLTQEVFWRVFVRMDGYQASGRFVPYLKRVAVNAGRNFLRDRRTRARREITIDEILAGMEEPGATSDPAQILSSRLLREEVRAALAALNKEQRRVVVLHYFGGRSVEAIADMLCCPVGTVKSRLFHSRRLLRRALHEARETEETRHDR